MVFLFLLPFGDKTWHKARPVREYIYIFPCTHLHILVNFRLTLGFIYLRKPLLFLALGFLFPALTAGTSRLLPFRGAAVFLLAVLFISVPLFGLPFIIVVAVSI